jgi:hypothetical protein
VAEYHGLRHGHLLPHRLLMRRLLNGGTLGALEKGPINRHAVARRRKDRTSSSSGGASMKTKITHLEIDATTVGSATDTFSLIEPLWSASTSTARGSAMRLL